MFDYWNSVHYYHQQFILSLLCILYSVKPYHVKEMRDVEKSSTGPNKMLLTVDTALKLLNYFSVETPEFGLSDLARAAEADKATVLRILNSFAAHGYVEQDPESKKFRLGPAILHLARIRENTVPLTSIIQPVLNRLAETTGETAHASLPDGNALVTIAIAVPYRSTRVFVDPAQRLPFHATASGVIYLSAAEPESAARILAEMKLSRHTELTTTTATELNSKIEAARKSGIAYADRTFETDTIGVAAAFLDSTGFARGTIAVAAVAARNKADSLEAISAEVRKSAAEVTRLLGGSAWGES